jgi:hypothetical protein
MNEPRPKSCDRARLWVSLALDDELSDFEDRLLEAHLERCPDCREYENGVRAATATLRMEPHVTPACPVVLPRKPRRALGPVRVAAPIAAAALAVVAFFGVQASTQRLHTQLQGASAGSSEINPFRAERRAQTRAQLLRVVAASGRVNRGANS